MQKKRSRKPSIADRALDLESYIHVQKEKISPKQIAFHGIDFRLTPEAVRAIQLARVRGERLRLKSSLLTDLRHYAILNSAIAFSTSYREADTEEIVLRSIVSLNGEATHQVRSDYLQDSALVLSITACHHWLVQQLLQGLYFRAKQRIEWVSWLLAALIVAVFVLLNWQHFPASDPISWLIVFLAIWLIQLVIALFLNWSRAGLRRWFLRQMLFGAFSRNDRKRRMALTAIEKL